MASQYDSIQTPKDLITRVSIQGFSTNQEDICRAQDIFGRAPIEDLVFLANDIGRVNDKGEPDPEGTWSSGRRGTRAIFYQILFHIWNWEDATRFYNQHSNPDYKEMKQKDQEIGHLKREVAAAQEEAAEHHEDCQEWMQRHKKEVDAHAETRKEADFYMAGYEAANQEIVRLKAKLYDLMVAKEEK